MDCDSMASNREMAAAETEVRPDLLDLENSSLTDDEKIDIVAARILDRYRHAFEELAK